MAAQNFDDLLVGAEANDAAAGAIAAARLVVNDVSLPLEAREYAAKILELKPGVLADKLRDADTADAVPAERDAHSAESTVGSHLGDFRFVGPPNLVRTTGDDYLFVHYVPIKTPDEAQIKTDAQAANAMERLMDRVLQRSNIRLAGETIGILQSDGTFQPLNIDELEKRAEGS